MTDQPPYIYDYLIRPFMEAQAQAQSAHGDAAGGLRAIAAFYREAAARVLAAADHIEGVAIAHERLALAVPAVAQAAADLGTAAERHDINNLRAVIKGEQELTVLIHREIDQRNRAIEARLERGEVERAEMLAILRELKANGNGGTP